MNKIPFALLASALLLSACTDQPSATPDGTPAHQADAQPPQPDQQAPRVDVPKTRFIHAEPAELQNCDFTKVLLQWDTSTAEKAVAVVEIYAGNAEGTPGLFASGGAVGQSETGPWVRPGSVFSLRDKATGAELEKLVIGGPVCP